MATITMSAQKEITSKTLQVKIQDIMMNALKETLLYGGAEEEEEILQKFGAKSGEMAKEICDAIVEIVSQAMVVGTLNGVVTASCAAGPVAGSNIDIVSGTELTLK